MQTEHSVLCKLQPASIPIQISPNLKSWQNLRKMGLFCMKENDKLILSTLLQCREVQEKFIFKTRSLCWSHSSGSGKWFEPQPRTEPFQLVKTVTSTARWPRFELQLCTEQLLGAHTVTSCIVQPWFGQQPCAELLKMSPHSYVSAVRPRRRKIRSYSAIYVTFASLKDKFVTSPPKQRQKDGHSM